MNNIEKKDDLYDFDDSYSVNVSLGLNNEACEFLNSIVEKIIKAIHIKNEEIYDRINEVKIARDNQKDSFDSLKSVDEYSRGVYNGLELAVSIIENKIPNFISIFDKHNHQPPPKKFKDLVT